MLKRVKIKNFKSLIDVDVELAPVTVLIGRSGAGKSNFVDALKFLSELINLPGRQGLDDLLHRNGGWTSIGPAGIKDFKTLWDITFDVAGTEFQYILELDGNHSQPPNAHPISREILLANGKKLFFRQAGKWIDEPVVGIPPDAIVALVYLAGEPLINDAFVALGRGIGAYDFPLNVLATPNSQPNPDRLGLLADASNYARVIRELTESLQWRPHWRQVEAALKTLSPQIQAVRYAPVVQSLDHLQITVGFNGRSVLLPLSSQSSGFRRVLAILLAIYQQPPKQTLIFEEPENGIFPGALDLIGECVSDAAKALGIQSIITTHSPQLLDKFAAESIRVVEYRGATQIAPLEPGRLGMLKEGLLQPSELLTVTGPSPAAHEDGVGAG